MSIDKRLVLEHVPAGGGRALDLGGGVGQLAAPLGRLGYVYTNVDVSPSGPAAVRGDAERLPFGGDSFDLVVSSDTLEHFRDPFAAVAEVRRVLKPDGLFVVWVPFLHPFHGDDYFRYTPLGLEFVMERGGMKIESLAAPLWVCSVIGQALVVLARRLRMQWLERPIERTAARLDRRFAGLQGSLGFAAAYVVHARPMPDAV